MRSYIHSWVYYMDKYIRIFIHEKCWQPNIFRHLFMSNLHSWIYSDIHLAKKNYICYTLFWNDDIKCLIIKLKHNTNITLVPALAYFISFEFDQKIEIAFIKNLVILTNPDKQVSFKIWWYDPWTFTLWFSCWPCI